MALEFEFVWLQPTIDLARTDRQKLAFLLRRERKAFANPDYPQGQQRFEADLGLAQSRANCHFERRREISTLRVKRDFSLHSK
ncbi:MAG: hypothetical protein B6D41_02290 [Chloroflexi bacterium UTCFX4]|nr:MAG: hypothetical protein B6D41_02290 [Chloroflexi bacterium UTCFX4]